MRRNIALALICLTVVLSTASLLGVLRHALARDKPALPEDPLEAERRRIREAMGDLVRPIDLSLWPEHLQPRPDLPDRDALRARIKPIDRPAWQDIREDRDARG